MNAVKKRKAAFREAIANGEVPPPKRLHTNTRDWRRKKDRELAKRACDLDGRAEVIQKKSAEADAIIAVTEAISQGVVDPADLSAGKPIRAVKGRENDPEFKRTLRHARRSPKGVARVTKAFGSGWSAMFKRAQEKAFKQVSDDFKSAAQTLKDVTERLSNVVPAFGKGLPDDVKSLPELVRRLKKAIARGQVGHGISERKQHKNNDLDDL